MPIVMAKKGESPPGELGPLTAEQVAELASGGAVSVSLLPELKAVEPPKAGKEVASETGAMQPAPCEHCGWPHGQKDPTTVDLDDWHEYIHSMTTGEPYVRTYAEVDGAVSFTFRELSSEAADACVTQIGRDYESYKVGRGQNDVLRLHADYRLTLGLIAVKQGTKTVQVPDFMATADAALANPDWLRAAVTRLYKEVLPREMVRRAAAAAFIRFENLQNKLIARSADPNFSRAIAGRP